MLIGKDWGSGSRYLSVASSKSTLEKRLKNISLRDDEGLMWQGLKVPTIAQMWAVLNPIHLEKEKFIKGVNILRKALSDKGFDLPTFIGAWKEL